MTEEYADPPRIFESSDAPRELRQWLNQASDDALTASQIEQLVSSFEQRIHTGGLGTPDALSSQVDGIKPWFKTSAGKLGLIAVVLGLGAAGTIGVAKTRSRTSVQSASSAVPSDTVSCRVGFAPASEHSAGSSNDVLPLQQPTDGADGAAAVDAGQAERPTPPAAPASSVARHGGAVKLGASARVVSGADSSSDSANEYQLLRAARQAASSDAARALALAKGSVN